MKSLLLISLLVLFLVLQTSARPMIRSIKTSRFNEDDKKNINYLLHFGYAKNIMNPIDYDEAVYTFAKLNRMATDRYTFHKYAIGHIKHYLKKLTTKPRCGDPDVGHGPFMSSAEKGKRVPRVKRYTIQSAWNKKDLTYKITKYSEKTDLTQAEQDSGMAEASQMWSDSTTGLSISKHEGDGEPDINIQFGTDKHAGCEVRFDDGGPIVAHGYYPEDGRIHFDDYETYTLGEEENKMNLVSIAVHEFGHALGLAHSADTSSVMHASFQPYSANFALSQDDINGIKYLYPENPDCKDVVWCADIIIEDECPELKDQCPNICNNCPS